MAQATRLSPQALIQVATGLIEAYNAKDWDRVRAGLTPDFAYDEVPTGRAFTGIEEAIEAWKGWAQAFPDSRGLLQERHATEDGLVVLELTWEGTHRGVLPTPTGSIAPTGKRIGVRACCVFQIAGEKARAQRHYFDMATLLGQLGVGPG